MTADSCLNKKPLQTGAEAIIAMMPWYSCYLAAGWFRVVFSLFFFVFFFPPRGAGREGKTKTFDQSSFF